MTAREELRARGAEIRRHLGLTNSSGAELLPGFANLTDEMVYGRVWARSGLALEERMLATLSALTSKQYLPQLGLMVGSALHIGLTPRLIQEVMLHCAMYVGIPSAESSLEVVNRVLAEKEIPQPEVTLNEADLDAMASVGEATKRELHGERADAGYAAPDSAAAELYATAVDYLYGEVWNRPDITLRQRMVCSIAAFTANQMESQQRKFFRSALSVGLSRGEVLEIIVQTAPYSGFPPALNALAAAEEVLS